MAQTKHQKRTREIPMWKPIGAWQCSFVHWSLFTDFRPHPTRKKESWGTFSDPKIIVGALAQGNRGHWPKQMILFILCYQQHGENRSRPCITSTSYKITKHYKNRGFNGHKGKPTMELLVSKVPFWEGASKVERGLYYLRYLKAVFCWKYNFYSVFSKRMKECNLKQVLCQNANRCFLGLFLFVCFLVVLFFSVFLCFCFVKRAKKAFFLQFNFFFHFFPPTGLSL